MSLYAYYRGAPNRGWIHIKDGRFIITRNAYTDDEAWLLSIRETLPSVKIMMQDYRADKVAKWVIEGPNKSRKWVRQN